jgi:hypothetical protein
MKTSIYKKHIHLVLPAKENLLKKNTKFITLNQKGKTKFRKKIKTKTNKFKNP